MSYGDLMDLMSLRLSMSIDIAVIDVVDDQIF